MAEIDDLKKEISKIKERNLKVEIDKEWETSKSRKILVSAFTYLAIGFYFSAIKVEQPWLNAIVPATAFLLSTLTLPFFRKLWQKIFLKKE